MSEEVKNFIDKLADGDNADAGEAFKDALRAKVGDALDVRRKELAGNLFNGQNETQTPGQETLNPEAEAHSDPKPEIADPGTFNQDGTVTGTMNKNGQAEIDLTNDNNQ